jgi:hypothetical protein
VVHAYTQLIVAGLAGFLVGQTKTAIEIVMLPVTYRVIAAIKRREPTYQPAV